MYIVQLECEYVTKLVLVTLRAKVKKEDSRTDWMRTLPHNDSRIFQPNYWTKYGDSLTIYWSCWSVTFILSVKEFHSNASKGAEMQSKALWVGSFWSAPTPDLAQRSELFFLDQGSFLK